MSDDAGSWVQAISEYRARRLRDGLSVWEDVESEPSCGPHTYLERFAVPGGWLYRCFVEDCEETASMVFVPRPPGWQE